MINKIRKYKIDIGLLWLRVLGGLGIMTHGYSKVFGGNMDGFITGVHNLGFPFPGFFGWLSALTEFIGGWLLVFGLGTRIAALFLLGNMCVAAFLQHANASFSVKEKALLYLTLAGTIEILGGGRFSLDQLIMRRRKSSQETSLD